MRKAVVTTTKTTNKDNKLFDSLKPKTETEMGINEIVAFMQKLDVELTDPFGGYLFYLMKCADSTRIVKEEFDNLTNHVNVDNIPDFKKKIPNLRKQFESKQTFSQVYDYLFDLYKETPQTKVLPFEVAEQLWSIYFKANFGLYKKFLQYLEVSAEKKPVNRDTWRMVNQFRANTKDDLTNYSQMDGWPVFVDHFVNFVKGK